MYIHSDFERSVTKFLRNQSKYLESLLYWHFTAFFSDIRRAKPLYTNRDI